MLVAGKAKKDRQHSVMFLHTMIHKAALALKTPIECPPSSVCGLIKVMQAKNSALGCRRPWTHLSTTCCQLPTLMMRLSSSSSHRCPFLLHTNGWQHAPAKHSMLCSVYSKPHSSSSNPTSTISSWPHQPSALGAAC